MGNEKIGYVAIAVIALFAVVGVFMMEPIAQDPEYHLFSDQRTVFGIPNFWNVISSLPFLMVGLFGLYGIFHSHRIHLLPDIRAAYILFFLGVSLVAFGSGYYHLRPDNASLLWDRLPMAIAFMALFSIVIGEFVSLAWGKVALWPLLALGVFSVLYWQSTESSGEGDLRLYALVQFLPMLLMPIILMTFKSTYTDVSGYWLLLGAYAVGKVFEFYDGSVQGMLLLSGHSIKHLVVALGVALLLRAYSGRKLVQ